MIKNNTRNHLHPAAEWRQRSLHISTNASKLECGGGARPGPAVLVNHSQASDWLEVRQEFAFFPAPAPTATFPLLLLFPPRPLLKFRCAQTHARNHRRGRGRRSRRERESGDKESGHPPHPLRRGARFLSLGA